MNRIEEYWAEFLKISNNTIKKTTQQQLFYSLKIDLEIEIFIDVPFLEDGIFKIMLRLKDKVTLILDQEVTTTKWVPRFFLLQ